MRKVYAFTILLFCKSLFANLSESEAPVAAESHSLEMIVDAKCNEPLQFSGCELPLACITPANAPTVVVIHGFLSSHRSMRRIGYNLRCRGAQVYLWDYPSRKRTLREHACHLTFLLNKIAREKPGCPIYFVTHSTGGLVLRAAFCSSNCPMEATIGRAVLIAPPNQGAMLARRLSKYQPVRAFMGKKTGRELICYRECDVQALGTFPPSMEILVLAGCKSPWNFLFCEPNDGFVTLEETRLETPHRHLVFNLTHSQLIQHSQIIARISKFILCGSSQTVEVKACN